MQHLNEALGRVEGEDGQQILTHVQLRLEHGVRSLEADNERLDCFVGLLVDLVFKSGEQVEGNVKGVRLKGYGEVFDDKLLVVLL